MNRSMKTTKRMIPRTATVTNAPKVYPFWAIFVLPSGELEVVGGEDKKLLENKVKNFEGKVIASWHENT
jgi:hypothetical protein